MASLYRKTITRYFLNGRRRTKDGKEVTKATPGARAKREKSKTWRGNYPGVDGKECDVSLGKDRELAELKLSELVRRARREGAGDIDPFEDHRKRPLAEHLEDFEMGLLAKGVTEKQAGQAAARCLRVIEACRFEKLADLSPSTVASYLRERRQAGLGIQTSNHYLAAIKSFANWLVKDRRLPSNPLAHLEKLNAKLDIRRVRRALSVDEIRRLVAAAERSGLVLRGLDGRTRAMLYRVALGTGFRASELASLTRESFDLDSVTPLVTLKAAYSKHRREDVLPVRSDLAAQLRVRFAEQERQSVEPSVVLSMQSAFDLNREPLFPGTWPEKGAKILRADLEAAGVPYETGAGVCDFHSLRHTFISRLIAAKVHPKVVQMLARHSSIGLTMDRYTHLELLDLAAGVAALPPIEDMELISGRATGTLDEAGAVRGCTNGCTGSSATKRIHPVSTASSRKETENEKPRVSLRKMQENTGLTEVHPAGLEPATFGSVDRCSSRVFERNERLQAEAVESVTEDVQDRQGHGFRLNSLRN